MNLHNDIIYEILKYSNSTDLENVQLLNHHFCDLIYSRPNLFINKLKVLPDNLKLLILLYKSNQLPYFKIKRILELACICNRLDIIIDFNSKGISLFEKLILLASSYDRLEIVDWLFKRNVKCNDSVLYLACKSGNLSIVKYLSDNGIELQSNFLNIAIANRHHHIYNYLLDQNTPIDQYTMKHICEIGDEIVFKRLLPHTTIIPNLMINAIKGGNVNIVKYLNQKCKIEFTYEAYQLAVRKGHLDIVKLMFNTNKLHQECLDLACFYGHFEIIKYYYQKKYHVSEIGFKNACINGNIDVIKFIYTPNYDENNINYAIKNNHYDVVKYCLKTINESTLLYAIYSENIEIFEYIYNQNPELYNPKILENAVTFGFTDCVKFLHQKGIIFSPQIIQNIIKSCYIDMIKYIYQHFQLTIDQIRTCDIFLNNNNYEIIKFIYQQYDSWKNYEMEHLKIQAIKNGDLKMLQYLNNKFGKKYYTNDLIYAVENSKLNIVKYFDTINVKISTNIVNYAVQYFDLDMVKYFINKGYKYDRNSILNNDKNIMYHYCELGLLNEIKYLCQIGMTINKNDFMVCCKYGHLDIIEYAVTVHCHKLKIEYYQSACMFGMLDLIIYFEQMGLKGNFESLLISCSNGRLEIVKHLMTKYNFRIGIIDTVDYFKYYEILKYLFWKDHNILISNTMFREICQMGNLNIIRLLISQGFQFKSVDISILFKYGHIECIKYLVNNNYELNSNMLKYAVISNDISGVKYLYDQKIVTYGEIKSEYEFVSKSYFIQYFKPRSFVDKLKNKLMSK